MAKKKSNNKHEQREINAAKKLAECAFKCLYENDIDDEDELEGLIDLHLERKEDHILMMAIAGIQDAQARAFLFDRIDDLSSCQDVAFSDGEPAQLRLFVVPVSINVEGGAVCPKYVKNIDALYKSFRKFGLIGENPTLILRQELFSRADLDVSPSEKIDMIRAHLPYFNPAEEGCPEMNQAINPKDEHGIAERYMLGFVVSGVMDEEPFNPDMDEQAFMEMQRNWNIFFQQTLAEQIGIKDVLIGAPCSIYEGFARHERVMVDVKFNIDIKTALLESAQKCKAVISLHINQFTNVGQIRVGFFDLQNGFIKGHVRTIFDPEILSDQVDNIYDELIENGISQVIKHDDVYEMEDDLDNPNFPMPTDPIHRGITESRTLH